MKRWLFVVTALVCLWGCSDDASQTTNSSSSASNGSGGSSSSSSSSTGGGGAGGEGGSQPTALIPCLDEPNALPRPPSEKLPCEYIPPGLSLPQ